MSNENGSENFILHSRFFHKIQRSSCVWNNATPEASQGRDITRYNTKETECRHEMILFYQPTKGLKVRLEFGQDPLISDPRSSVEFFCVISCEETLKKLEKHSSTDISIPQFWAKFWNMEKFCKWFFENLGEILLKRKSSKNLSNIGEKN